MSENTKNELLSKKQCATPLKSGCLIGTCF